jgi:hypothetical protein
MKLNYANENQNAAGLAMGALTYLRLEGLCGGLLADEAMFRFLGLGNPEMAGGPALLDCAEEQSARRAPSDLLAEKFDAMVADYLRDFYGVEDSDAAEYGPLYRLYHACGKRDGLMSLVRRACDVIERRIGARGKEKDERKSLVLAELEKPLPEGALP